MVSAVLLTVSTLKLRETCRVYFDLLFLTSALQCAMEIGSDRKVSRKGGLGGCEGVYPKGDNTCWLLCLAIERPRSSLVQRGL